MFITPEIATDLKDFEAQRRQLVKQGTPRYTVQAHPTKRGYTLHDLIPQYSYGEDVEGVGWYSMPRKQLPHTVGWYKFKRDAVARADELNNCERRLK